MHALAILVILALGPPATAQVVFQGSSIQTTASANTPSCSDPGDGGVGVPAASASCGGPVGYTAAASSEASFTLTSDGGLLSVSGQAAAAAPGTPPTQQSSAIGSGNGLANWFLGSDTLYTLVVEGDPTVDFSGTGGSGLPPSGTVPTGSYGLSAVASAGAVANDTGPLSAAESIGGTVEITLVPVGASDRIMGTVLAGGSPQAGLRVEAFDGTTLIASTQTASDGSYLLASIPTTVTLRSSDPERVFATDLSPPLTPPASYDADLAPRPVPSVGGVGAVALAAFLAGVGGRILWAGPRRRGGAH